MSKHGFGRRGPDGREVCVLGDLQRDTKVAGSAIYSLVNQLTKN